MLSPSGVVTSTLHVPPFAVVEYVVPSISTLTFAPSGAFVVPLMVGVLSLVVTFSPPLMVVVMLDNTVFTVKLLVVAALVFPASSVAVALIVWAASLKAVNTWYVQLPFSSAVMLIGVPLSITRVTVAFASVVPMMVGVLSPIVDPSTGVAIATSGAVVSLIVIEIVAIFESVVPSLALKVKLSVPT